MRADAGLTVRTSSSSRQRPGGAARDRVLLAVGAAVAAAAAIAYLTAIATHPVPAMLKGFDLRVYLGAARQALSHPGRLYAWTYDGHPGIQFTYPPFAALLFAAGRALPFTALMGLVTGISVLALGVTVAIAFRELGWRGAPRLGATLLVAGLALWTEPAQRALFLGQVEILLMALVTWDLCQPDGRRVKGAATGLAAGVKLVPLLFIAYLLLTRRFRQGAVATAAFAVTVVVGFAAFPSASVTWWLGGDFVAAGRTGFVGGQQNQSLRGALTRLAGSVDGAQPAWLIAAVGFALAGLAAAVLLHRRGLVFAGLMTCALTALLISPISWDHHWIWLAPGLALLIDAGHRAGQRAGQRAGHRAGHRAGRAWYALAAATWAVFAAWPDFWSAKAGLLQGGLIGYAPATAWAYGDNPAYAEYHWHGLQLLAGNLELLAGLALFAVALAVAVRLRRLRAGRAARPPSPSAARAPAARHRHQAGSCAWPAGCPTRGTPPGQPGTPGQTAGPRHPRPGSSATRTGTAARP
jgi:alpha-1,2-mannosyltransferase